MIEDKAYELQQVRKMAVDKYIKRRRYDPVPDDEVDLRMAEFVNERKLEVPFIRECSEMYLFGTSQVQISIIEGHLHAHIPGGQIPLEEYVQMSLPAELKKLQPGKRRDSGK